METRYNIYFAGQLLEGQDLLAVRTNIAKAFNANEQTLDKLFSGKAQLLKRDCDKATALKYKQAIERAGAQPIIKAVETTQTESAPAPKPMTAAEKIAALASAPDEVGYGTSNTTAAAVTESEVHDGDVGLAPTGSDVLREDERTAPVVRDIDTSGLAIDASAERLSDVATVTTSAPDTSHLDMGDVGDIIPNLPSQQQAVSPNIDNIKLTPDGTDFSDCAAPEPVEPSLDLSELGLAPEGAEILDQRYQKQDQAAAPSTDHLTLED